MAIQPISSSELMAQMTSTQNKKTGDANFTDILTNAINDAAATEAEDEAGMVALLAGGDTEIHTGMIESQKAELALNLAIQIRNKCIEAYNEVMRMQI